MARQYRASMYLRQVAITPAFLALDASRNGNLGRSSPVPPTSTAAAFRSKTFTNRILKPRPPTSPRGPEVFWPVAGRPWTSLESSPSGIRRRRLASWSARNEDSDRSGRLRRVPGSNIAGHAACRWSRAALGRWEVLGDEIRDWGCVLLWQGPPDRRWATSTRSFPPVRGGRLPACINGRGR